MAAPTERAMPAISSTKVMPIAMIATCAAWATMLAKFCGVRNFDDMVLNSTTTAINSSNGAMRRAVKRQRDPAAIMSGAHKLCPHRGFENGAAVEIGRPEL